MMKKCLIALSVLLCAVCVIAKDPLNAYVPADSMFAGTADGYALLQSKCYNSFLFAATQKTLEDQLKEMGKTLQQAKNESGIGVFFFKIKSVAPQIQTEGGAVIRGVTGTSFASMQNLTLKSAEAELKKSGLSLAMLQQYGMKLEIIKIEGKSALLLSCAEPVIQIAMIGVSGNQMQVRFALGAPVEKKLFRPLPRQARSVLTKELQYKSLFSLAANIPAIVKLGGQEAAQDPVAKSLKTVSASVNETNDKLVLQAKVDTVSADSANMIQAQLKAMVEQMKANPQTKTLAEMVQINTVGNTVNLKAAMPVDYLLAMMAQLAMAAQQQQQAPAAAPAGK